MPNSIQPALLAFGVITEFQESLKDLETTIVHFYYLRLFCETMEPIWSPRFSHRKKIIIEPPPPPRQSLPSLFFLLPCFFGWMGDCSTFNKVSQTVWRGREEIPLSSEENGKFCSGRIFYQVGGNLTGNDFDHLNHFQS